VSSTPDERYNDEARRYWEGYRDGYDDGKSERQSRYELDEPPPAIPAGPDYPPPVGEPDR
jgi:hypothetical protein